MATNVANQWEPGIGDPTVYGWTTVVAYSIVALLCWRAARLNPNRERMIWSLMASMLTFLCINKQLDLQSLLTQEARGLLRTLGLYELRRVLQVGFILSLVAVTAWVTLYLWRKLRFEDRSVRIALTGMALILSFVMTRAASFHHLDNLLPVIFLGVSFNFFFENLGIGIVAAGVVLSLQRSK